MPGLGTQGIAVPTSDPLDQDFVVGTGQGFDGVGLVEGNTRFGGVFGSGALLSGGRHVLTAAHVVDEFRSGSGTVRFDLPGGSTTINVSRIILHPGYSGIADGNDLAILELSRAAPAAATRYEIFRDGNEIGQVNTRVGYGIAGNGTDGESISDPTAGDVKRFGQNIYDADGAIFNSTFGAFGLDLPAGTTLGLDFDDGTSAHDAFGIYFGLRDTGLGASEVNSTRGDSGGPVFIDGKIAGITSFGLPTARTDANGSFDAGFGEFSGDTRVSAFADWIDGIVPPAATTSTDGDDSLIGGSLADRLAGGIGHDTLSGGIGDDVLYGNKNTDVLRGGSGNDTLFGGQNDGPESFNSGVAAFRQGVETLYGGDGSDFLYGNHGADVLSGEAGEDALYGGQEDDTLVGGGGRDSLFGNLDDDRLYGGDGNDGLTGASGNDLLFGDNGDDLLSGGLGDDELNGGDGADTAVYSGNRTDYEISTGASGLVSISDNRGIDGTDTLRGVENLQFADQTIGLSSRVAAPTPFYDFI